MGQPTGTNSAEDRARVDALRADLEGARGHLARITAEYEELLLDHDTIQEDCDSTAQAVAEARAVVARAETALERAEAGQYGTCKRCGSPIPQERLAVLPDATTCISCA